METSSHNGQHVETKLKDLLAEIQRLEAGWRRHIHEDAEHETQRTEYKKAKRLADLENKTPGYNSYVMNDRLSPEERSSTLPDPEPQSPNVAAPPDMANTRRKRPAATASDGDMSQTAQAPKRQKSDVQVSRTISFDEVHQDGKADTANEIVKFPRRHGRWYIYCTARSIISATAQKPVLSLRPAGTCVERSTAGTAPRPRLSGSLASSLSTAMPRRPSATMLR